MLNFELHSTPVKSGPVTSRARRAGSSAKLTTINQARVVGIGCMNIIRPLQVVIVRASPKMACGRADGFCHYRHYAYLQWYTVNHNYELGTNHNSHPTTMGCMRYTNTLIMTNFHKGCGRWIRNKITTWSGLILLKIIIV